MFHKLYLEKKNCNSCRLTNLKDFICFSCYIDAIGLHFLKSKIVVVHPYFLQVVSGLVFFMTPGFFPISPELIPQFILLGENFDSWLATNFNLHTLGLPSQQQCKLVGTISETLSCGTNPDHKYLQLPHCILIYPCYSIFYDVRINFAD